MPLSKGVLGLSTPKATEAVGIQVVVPELERKPTGAERRTHERVMVDIEVDYRADDTFLFAYVTDISAMGIFIRTNDPEAPGTLLNLRFTPPGGEPLELEGEVMWINPLHPTELENRNPGMGVQFVRLDEERRGRLLDFVRTFAVLNDPADDDKSGKQ